MSRKKPFDLPVVVTDGIDQGGQLTDQRQHETGPGPAHDGMGAKGGILAQVQDFLHGFPRPRVGVMFEEGRQLIGMGRFQVFQRRIGLEKGEGNRLVEFAEDLEGQRIVILQAGGQLVKKSGLLLHQARLIPRKQLEFLYQGMVGLQSAQTVVFLQPVASEQGCIDGIRLGSG